MVRAKGKFGGKDIIFLGLTSSDVERLRAGDSVIIEGAPLGYDGYIKILTGKTEQDIINHIEDRPVSGQLH